MAIFVVVIYSHWIRIIFIPNSIFVYIDWLIYYIPVGVKPIPRFPRSHHFRSGCRIRGGLV
jgi:hypothetical protein